MLLVGITGVVIQFLLFLLSEVNGSHHLRHKPSGDQYLMKPRPAKGFLSVTKLQVQMDLEKTINANF